jgi:hypothetical protein
MKSFVKCKYWKWHPIAWSHCTTTESPLFTLDQWIPPSLGIYHVHSTHLRSSILASNTKQIACPHWTSRLVLDSTRNCRRRVQSRNSPLGATEFSRHDTRAIPSGIDSRSRLKTKSKCKDWTTGSHVFERAMKWGCTPAWWRIRWVDCHETHCIDDLSCPTWDRVWFGIQNIMGWNCRYGISFVLFAIHCHYAQIGTQRYPKSSQEPSWRKVSINVSVIVGMRG